MNVLCAFEKGVQSKLQCGTKLNKYRAKKHILLNFLNNIIMKISRFCQRFSLKQPCYACEAKL